MDMLTELMKTEIKKQYKSVRQFAAQTGIPQTTLASAFKKGIDGTAYATVVKICRVLDIKLPLNNLPMHIDAESLEFLRKLSTLDEIGVHTVKTVLEAEYNRCR